MCICVCGFFVTSCLLGNVAVANALQPEAARRRASPHPFNYDAMRSLKSLNLSAAVLLRFIHYFTLWPWLLTFDLDHLQCIASDVMELFNKFERNRAIRGGVIAISVFDHMTLNIALRVALGSGIIFTKFDLWQRIHAWIIAFLMLIRYVTLWPWPLTSWPLTCTTLWVSYV